MSYTVLVEEVGRQEFAVEAAVSVLCSGRILSGGLWFRIVFPVFGIELFQDTFPFDQAEQLFILDDRDGFQVFGDHDAGQVLHGGIRAGHDDFFGHELSRCAGEQLLESLFVFFEVAIVDIGPQEIDILWNMGLDFLVQEVRVGDNTDDRVVVVNDGDGRNVMFDKHIDEIENRRIFFSCDDIFFHNICCCFCHSNQLLWCKRISSLCLSLL